MNISSGVKYFIGGIAGYFLASGVYFNYVRVEERLSKSKHLALREGDLTKIEIHGGGYAEFSGGAADETSLSIVNASHDWVGILVRSSSLEVHTRSSVGNAQYFYFDTNADGLPDYRIIKDSKTGERKREGLLDATWK